MAMHRNRFLFLLVLMTGVSSCEKMIDPAYRDSGYPEAIDQMIQTKCATAGCHNDKSYQNAAGLNLTTHAGLMRGSVNGAVVIPYAPTQSSLLQFINTFDDLGTKAVPTMPVNGEALSREQVLLFRNWIQAGCPDRNGQIPFASSPESRPKAYIANQGCDLVSVLDAETGLVMRYVQVGGDPNQIELPHCLRTSPDGKYWYVCFANGNLVQKFECNGDKLVGQVSIGAGAWNILKISPDSRYAYVSDLSSNGKFAYIDLQSMTLIKTLAGSGLFTFPHGMEISESGDTLYATAQYGNFIYRIIPDIPEVDQIVLAKGQVPVTTPQTLDPHEILTWKEHNVHIITCQASNEIRLLDARKDTLKHIIPMGTYPLEMAMSKKRNLLFVVCQEDVNPVYPGFRGSVYVVDMNTMKVVRKVYEKFFQPHGIAVDDRRDLLYVASRNADPTGPAPHHVSECAGRNGFYHVIDLNTWQRIRPPAEISVDPYSADVRR